LKSNIISGQFIEMETFGNKNTNANHYVILFLGFFFVLIIFAVVHNLSKKCIFVLDTTHLAESRCRLRISVPLINLVFFHFTFFCCSKILFVFKEMKIVITSIVKIGKIDFTLKSRSVTLKWMLLHKI